MSDNLRDIILTTQYHFGGAWQARHGTVWLDESSVDEIRSSIHPNNAHDKDAVIDRIMRGFRAAHEARWGNFPMVVN